jgi:hypothetical protein
MFLMVIFVIRISDLGKNSTFHIFYKKKKKLEFIVPCNYKVTALD